MYSLLIGVYLHISKYTFALPPEVVLIYLWCIYTDMCKIVHMTNLLTISKYTHESKNTYISKAVHVNRALVGRVFDGRLVRSRAESDPGLE